MSVRMSLGGTGSGILALIQGNSQNTFGPVQHQKEENKGIGKRRSVCERERERERERDSEASKKEREVSRKGKEGRK